MSHIHSIQVTPEVSEYVGGFTPTSVEALFYTTEGGVIFTYGGCGQNHDMYSKTPEMPFPTLEAAMECALKPAECAVAVYEKYA